MQVLYSNKQVYKPPQNEDEAHDCTALETPQKAIWQVWMQGLMMAQEIWDASAAQKGGSGSKRKRQDNACTTTLGTTTATPTQPTQTATQTPSPTAPNPDPQFTSVNNNGAGTCGVIGNSCQEAVARYADNFLYENYTSLTYVPCSSGDPADQGCTAIYACGSGKASMTTTSYEGVALTGAQIKAAFAQMYNGGYDVTKCGSAYFSNGCHVSPPRGPRLAHAPRLTGGIDRLRQTNVVDARTSTERL